MKEILYGVAYYDEYMPYERLEKDIVLMKEAGINVVRIAESTWSTLEPQDGKFDFKSVDRVIKKMGENNIKVIVGTPTYAVPTWLVKRYPDVLATTKNGKNKYGARQNMDISNPQFLFFAERMIRRLIEHVAKYENVIGYQADNETKHYGSSGDNVQENFVKYMKEKYITNERMNQELGLDYWSNRINSWEDFPNVDATVNASLAGDFETFRRLLVTNYLAWQVDIITEYKRDDQFITQNFDFEWRGHSFGVQPDVNHFEAAKAFDIASVDIYHPTQDDLTGAEISFGGDIARSLKGNNYFVMETQAQGHAGWMPYPGQLRLQAYSHLASGANMVAYWHYHSIHNSFETYWRGLLSQDFEPNKTYAEAKIIGNELKNIGEKLVNLKKVNKAAFLISNEALSAFNWFKMYRNMDYNTIFRRMYDALYKLNIECDFVNPESDNIEEYEFLVVPPLYAASDQLLHRLNTYVEKGGHVVYGIRSGFSNENVKVRTTHQPGIIGEACGIYYNHFTQAKEIRLQSKIKKMEGDTLEGWIELIEPKGATVLARYNHPYWSEYAAITHQAFGKGTATYIGCSPSEQIYSSIYEYIFEQSGILETEHPYRFPIIIKSGVNDEGKRLIYIMNYSSQVKQIQFPYFMGKELFANKIFEQNDQLTLEAWDTQIFEI